MSGAAPDLAHDLPRLEKYELIEEIGHGGMATVYKARDKRLNREVAVKIIHRHLRDNAEVATRFLAEARAAASLKHRGIVEVYDVSSEEDREKYLVAELVRGVTLRKLYLDHRDMPTEVAAAIVLEVCDAIQHAHESGIVHRDVKPENVLVELLCHREGRISSKTPTPGLKVATEDGEAPVEAPAVSSGASPSSRKAERITVKITDFGIAKVLDAQGVTSTGQVLGSPAHMAPEQIEGGDIDARTDVFALGVLLYEGLVGHLPFEGKNPAQVLRKVIEGEYSPVDVERGDVGTRWGRIVHAALALEPKDRTTTPAELAEQIRGELRALGVVEPHEEIVDFFDEPEGFRLRHTERLVQRLLVRGEKARKQGDVPGAAADFNRALALAPQDAEVQRRVIEMSRGRDRRALLKRVGMIAAGSLALGAAAFGVSRVITDDVRPLPTLPTTARPVATDALDPLEGLVDPDLDEDWEGEDPPPTSGSVARPRPDRTPPRITVKLEAPPRTVVFAVSPPGAKLLVDGAVVEFGSRPKLKPGRHDAVVSPKTGDPCCEEATVGFTVPPAETGAEETPVTIPISAKFRQATVILAGAPADGKLVCGSLGFTLTAGGSTSVSVKSAEVSAECSAISAAGSKPKIVSLRPGITNTISWPGG